MRIPKLWICWNNKLASLFCKSKSINKHFKIKRNWRKKKDIHFNRKWITLRNIWKSKKEKYINTIINKISIKKKYHKNSNCSNKKTTTYYNYNKITKSFFRILLIYKRHWLTEIQKFNHSKQNSINFQV